MELQTLAERARISMNSLVLLHRFGLVDLVNLTGEDLERLIALLDQSYPQDKPSHDARGLYRLSVHVACNDLSLTALLARRVPEQPEAAKFLAMPESERELLRERRPKTYERLTAEAARLSETEALPSTMLQRLRQLNRDEISSIIKTLNSLLAPQEMQIITSLYFDDIGVNQIAKSLNCPIEQVSHGQCDALRRIVDNGTLTAATIIGPVPRHLIDTPCLAYSQNTFHP